LGCPSTDGVRPLTTHFSRGAPACDHELCGANCRSGSLTALSVNGITAAAVRRPATSTLNTYCELNSKDSGAPS